MNSRPPSHHGAPKHPNVSGWLQKLGHPNSAQSGIIRILLIATVVVALCGLGYYMVDPAIESIGEGFWLAFTTAATVGYGDLVPSTAESRVFSVIVVVVGFAVLSLVTASISALLVGKQERMIEYEILHDLHKQVRLLREEIAELRQEGHLASPAAASPPNADTDQPSPLN